MSLKKITAVLKRNVFNTDEKEMFREAKKARYKLNFILQILIFIAVIFAAQIIMGVIIAILEIVWMFTDADILSSIYSGDIDDVMAMVSSMPSWLVVAQLFLTVIEIILPVVYCRFIEKRSLRSMGFAKKGCVKNYLTGYAVGAVMILAAGGIAALTGSISIKISASISVVYLLLFFVGYLIQGMAEEVMVRGYFMVSLANSVNSCYAAAVAVGVSSAAFALLHTFNPGITVLAMVNLVLSGLFFALYILRTDNILGACAAHSAWNFFQGNIIGVQVSGLTMDASVFNATATGSSTLINGGSFGLEGGLAVTIVEIAAIILVCVLPKKK